MRRHVTLALAAAVALGVASQAQAAITLTVTTINPSLLSSVVPAGYSGYLLTLTASGLASDGTTEIVSSVDFSSTAAGLTGPIGIYTTGGANILFQADRQGPQGFSTPTTLNTLENTYTTGQVNDSTFLAFGYWNKSGSAASENETDTIPEVDGTYILDSGRYGTTTPGDTTAKPSLASQSATFGFGNSMTFAGGAAVTTAPQPVFEPLTTTELALVIAPTNGGNVFITGQLLDQKGSSTGTFLVQSMLINGTAPVPEPASLGVLALGGLSLLAKRRKRA